MSADQKAVIAYHAGEEDPKAYWDQRCLDLLDKYAKQQGAQDAQKVIAAIADPQKLASAKAALGLE